jgi:DNA-binding transcriptional ArsR family regulator/uncharacterized protein YndB with AHSA1/START domain
MKSPASDAVFRALADPSRRRILDLLKAKPGLTVGELGEHFDFSRFAVMKHLRILERNGLVVPRREGKTKRLYLNAVPIQTIYDRWISQYSALWASQLTSLKYELEGEDRPMPAAVAQLQHVHVVHIRTTPEKLWAALTQPELTRQYYYHTDVITDWKIGSRIEYLRVAPDGKKEIALAGEVLEFAPHTRLAHTFSFPSNDDEPTKVTYELEPIGEMVKLTMTHEGFAGETKTYQSIKGGWTPIFDGLKSLLETGKALEFPPM